MSPAPRQSPMLHTNLAICRVMDVHKQHPTRTNVIRSTQQKDCLHSRQALSTDRSVAALLTTRHQLPVCNITMSRAAISSLHEPCVSTVIDTGFSSIVRSALPVSKVGQSSSSKPCHNFYSGAQVVPDSGLTRGVTSIRDGMDVVVSYVCL